ncbi:hypothetical protein LXA43DRAFT_1069674 [Ganoderma leucocontextum]|nr:hypothetical protein LXA43DRAFT_1069674 [Ganoderma leucocontextum]
MTPVTGAGPFYVVFGGPDPGIHNARPTATALGEFDDLLPLIVACTTADRANAIYALWGIFHNTPPDDAHSLAYQIEHSGLDVREYLTYAIRTGVQTGIWIGFLWKDISRFTKMKPKPGKKQAPKGEYERFDDAIFAFRYMLNKPGSNMPLLIPGEPVPPPAPSARIRRSPSPPTVVTSTQATRRSSADTASATMGRMSPIKKTLTTRQSDLNDVSHALEQLTLGGPSLEIQFLRRILAPPKSMEPDGQANPPISLGSRADAELIRRGVSKGVFLRVLATRVHAPSRCWCTEATCEAREDVENLSSNQTQFSIGIDNFLTLTALETSIPTPRPMASENSKKAKKLPKPARKIAGKRVKFPWRRRKPAVAPSYADKAALKQKRDTDKAAIKAALEDADLAIWEIAEQLHGQFPRHSAKHYYQLLMQRSNLKKRKRKISLWNTFVSQEMRKYNDEQDGDRKRVSNDHIKTLSERWQNMTQEEREEAVGDGAEELSERLENRKEGAHRYHDAAFTDGAKTLASLEAELATLHIRTDMEAVLVVTRGQWDDYHIPFIYTTPKGDQAFEMLSKITVKEFANHREQVNTLKQLCRDLIFHALQETSTRGIPTKMYYINFEDHITAKYGLVLENWPLEKFAAPGSFNSLPVLTVLYNAWKNGVTRFRSLSNEEWMVWKAASTSGAATTGVTLSPEAISAGEVNVDADAEAAEHHPNVGDSDSTSANAATDRAAAESLATAPTPTSVSHSTTAHPAESTPAQTAGQKRPFVQFINSVGAADGSGLQVTKKPRKQRSDKGVWRKKAANASSENAPPATSS